MRLTTTIDRMTPDDLRHALDQALPKLPDNVCLCSNLDFRKTLSFDFADYDIAPTGLADTEILIDLVLRQSRRYGIEGGECGSVFTCLHCGCVMSETWEDYSISMSRSTVSWDGKSQHRGCYAVGFFGLVAADFAQIHDFDQIALGEFLQRIGLS
jgi:hypothetical protein